MSNPLLRVKRTSPLLSGRTPRKLTPDERTERRLRRPAWRQRLVEAERGFSHSLRADSALYLHLFVDSLLLATCFVLGLSATHWIVVTLAITVMLSAEMFSQGLLLIAAQLADRIGRQVIAMAAAAKLLAIFGSTSAVGMVLWLRLRELFGG